MHVSGYLKFDSVDPYNVCDNFLKDTINSKEAARNGILEYGCKFIVLPEINSVVKEIRKLISDEILDEVLIKILDVPTVNFKGSKSKFVRAHVFDIMEDKLNYIENFYNVCVGGLFMDGVYKNILECLDKYKLRNSIDVADIYIIRVIHTRLRITEVAFEKPKPKDDTIKENTPKEDIRKEDISFNVIKEKKEDTIFTRQSTGIGKSPIGKKKTDDSNFVIKKGTPALNALINGIEAAIRRDKINGHEKSKNDIDDIKSVSTEVIDKLSRISMYYLQFRNMHKAKNRISFNKYMEYIRFMLTTVYPELSKDNGIKYMLDPLNLQIIPYDYLKSTAYLIANRLDHEYYDLCKMVGRPWSVEMMTIVELPTFVELDEDLFNMDNI